MPVENELKKILWMLECCEYNNFWYELVLFYATSEQDAEDQAQRWIRQAPRSLVRVGLRAYPRGFIVHHTELQGSM